MAMTRGSKHPPDCPGLPPRERPRWCWVRMSTLRHYAGLLGGGAGLQGPPSLSSRVQPTRLPAHPLSVGWGRGAGGEVLPGTGRIWDRGSSVLEFQASNINRTRAPFEFQTPGPVLGWSRGSTALGGGGGPGRRLGVKVKLGEGSVSGAESWEGHIGTGRRHRREGPLRAQYPQHGHHPGLPPGQRGDNSWVSAATETPVPMHSPTSPFGHLSGDSRPAHSGYAQRTMAGHGAPQVLVHLGSHLHPHTHSHESQPTPSHEEPAVKAPPPEAHAGRGDCKRVREGWGWPTERTQAARGNAGDRAPSATQPASACPASDWEGPPWRHPDTRSLAEGLYVDAAGHRNVSAAHPDASTSEFKRTLLQEGDLPVLERLD